MTGLMRHNDRAVFLSGMFCTTRSRTLERNKRGFSAAVASTHCPDSESGSAREPSTRSVGLANRSRESSLGLKVSSKVTSSPGPMKPESGLMAKCGASCKGSHSNRVPISPWFSSCTLRVAVALRTTGPNGTASVSSRTSIAWQAPCSMSSARGRLESSANSSSLNACTRLLGANESATSIASRGLSVQTGTPVTLALLSAIVTSIVLSKEAASRRSTSNARRERLTSVTVRLVSSPACKVPKCTCCMEGVASSARHSHPSPLKESGTV
mmetsp:Transcript_8752/g.22286  ORF Transcript_8752/g.22286 Transcript_8752/m.22286 type:complete len:269 (-) Transcript_8752:5721-6527(-)